MYRKIFISLVTIVILATGCNTSTSYQPVETKSKFLLDKRSYEVGESIPFKNTSTGYSTVYWDFGDGSTSTAISPIHIYKMPGDYYPKLTITGNNQTVSYEYKISIIGDPIVDGITEEIIGPADHELATRIIVTFSDTIASVGREIIFSTDTTIDFNWNLDDNQTQLGSAGEVTYIKAGKKLINISLENASILSQYLHIYESDITPTSINVGGEISATASADFDIKWMTEDGRIFEDEISKITFPDPGNSIVKLLVSETDSILESYTIVVKELAPTISSVDIDRMLNALANAGISRSEKDVVVKDLEILCKLGSSTTVTGSLPGNLDQLIIKLRMEASRYIEVALKTEIKISSSDKIEELKIVEYNTRDID